MKISIDLAKLKTELQATADKLNKATRPAAQAGAQIIYERARYIVASELVSKRPHMFHIDGRVYGPYKPLTLFKSIYQAFSKDNSFTDQSTYHVSFNKDKAPYGFAVEFGDSKNGSMSFIGRAHIETRAAVRKAIKKRYLEEIKK